VSAKHDNLASVTTTTMQTDTRGILYHIFLRVSIKFVFSRYIVLPCWCAHLAARYGFYLLRKLSARKKNRRQTDQPQTVSPCFGRRPPKTQPNNRYPRYNSISYWTASFKGHEMLVWLYRRRVIARKTIEANRMQENALDNFLTLNK